MSSWISDLGYSLRRLLRAPGFTFTSIVLLALTMSVVIVLSVIVDGRSDRHRAPVERGVRLCRKAPKQHLLQPPANLDHRRS